MQKTPGILVNEAVIVGMYLVKIKYPSGNHTACLTDLRSAHRILWRYIEASSRIRLKKEEHIKLRESRRKLCYGEANRIDNEFYIIVREGKKQ